MLGFQRRLVRRWECDTDMPHEGFLPQISHTEPITHRHCLSARRTEQWYEVSDAGVRSLQWRGADAGTKSLRRGRTAAVGGGFRDLLHAHQARIDQLNVYPVADRDTGTNMARTLDAVVGELDATR